MTISISQSKSKPMHIKPISNEQWIFDPCCDCWMQNFVQCIMMQNLFRNRKVSKSTETFYGLPLNYFHLENRIELKWNPF